MNALRLPWPRLLPVAALLLCATLPMSGLRGANATPWFAVGARAGDDSARCAISGDQVDLVLGGTELRAFGARHRTVLKGDFDVAVRIETDAASAEAGGNRRTQLLFVSTTPDRAGKEQFYVGIYQKTVGELAVTGGEYRAMTNLILDGKGGRLATRPLRGSHRE